MKPLENRSEGDVDRKVMEKFFPGVTSGVFVDVGAANPDYLSISALYRKIGWNVLAIEPNPKFCEMYRQKGFTVFPYACGDHDEDDVEFCLVDSHGAAYENGQVSYESFSSLSIKDSYRALKPDLDISKIRVQLRRLDTILQTEAPELTHIDVLSVDTEGWELEVMRGLNLRKYQPRVVILENLLNSREYHTFMRQNGYYLWQALPPNDVYVRWTSLIEYFKNFFFASTRTASALSR